MYFIIIVIPVIVSLIVSTILFLVFKDTDKVDQGYAFNYYKLSFRRKMIRTLTSLPILAVACIILYFTAFFSLKLLLLLMLLTLFLGAVQFLYNYKMWKKEENVQPDQS